MPRGGCCDGFQEAWQARARHDAAATSLEAIERFVSDSVFQKKEKIARRRVFGAADERQSTRV